MPEADAEIRQQIEAEAAEHGWGYLHQQLAEFDPVSAARIHPNDPQLLSRELEDNRVSGQIMTALRQQQTAQSTEAAASGLQQLPYTVASLAIAPQDRQGPGQGFTHEVGDQVLFGPEDRYEVEVGGTDYIMLRERDLHAVAASRIEASTGLYL